MSAPTRTAAGTGLGWLGWCAPHPGEPQRAGHGPGMGCQSGRPEILVLRGVLAIVGGIICFAEPAKSRPAFFPGTAVPSGRAEVILVSTVV